LSNYPTITTNPYRQRLFTYDKGWVRYKWITPDKTSQLENSILFHTAIYISNLFSINILILSTLYCINQWQYVTNLYLSYYCWQYFISISKITNIYLPPNYTCPSWLISLEWWLFRKWTSSATSVDYWNIFRTSGVNLWKFNWLKDSHISHIRLDFLNVIPFQQTFKPINQSINKSINKFYNQMTSVKLSITNTCETHQINLNLIFGCFCIK